mgnify:CR=1 FL=1
MSRIKIISMPKQLSEIQPAFTLFPSAGFRRLTRPVRSEIRNEY